MRPQYYSTKDLMEILSVSKSEANRLMHMFEQRGELLRYGKLLRVSAKALDKWIGEVMDHNNQRIEKQRARLIRIS